MTGMRLGPEINGKRVSELWLSGTNGVETRFFYDHEWLEYQCQDDGGHMSHWILAMSNGVETARYSLERCLCVRWKEEDGAGAKETT